MVGVGVGSWCLVGVGVGVGVCCLGVCGNVGDGRGEWDECWVIGGGMVLLVLVFFLFGINVGWLRRGFWLKWENFLLVVVVFWVLMWDIFLWIDGL